MSVDKLVDSAQLDTDLTTVANAIRTKGGTSASLAFPADFVSAIGAIPTGGGDPNENLLKLAKDALTSVELDMGNTVMKERMFNSAKALLTAKIWNIADNSGQYIFYNCTNLQTAVLTGSNARLPSQTFLSCTSLTKVDLAGGINLRWGSSLSGATSLNVLVIRDSSVIELGNTNVFNNTPFKSGGTGGTIYIPKALYDHLGDGGSYDYKAATNWSTINGYGTITWAKIEGSIYENAYADGTPIS